jgi:hypothetical protein
MLTYRPHILSSRQSGAPARQARHKIFSATDPWCESGPGQGGAGGAGGAGGPGGIGGQGGDGGYVTLVTLPDRLSTTIFTAVRVINGGGSGGLGGPAGAGGIGGPGGAAREFL